MISLPKAHWLPLMLMPAVLLGCDRQADEPAMPEAPTMAQAGAVDTAWWPLDSELPVAIPETRQDPDVVEVFNSPDGPVEVRDPFRWLENDVRVDPELADWVKAQNAATFAYLETLPGRE